LICICCRFFRAFVVAWLVVVQHKPHSRLCLIVSCDPNPSEYKDHDFYAEGYKMREAVNGKFLLRSSFFYKGYTCVWCT
jgi:hypothetical protein